jgi:ABC-type transporter Mla MlaB component
LLGDEGAPMLKIVGGEKAGEGTVLHLEGQVIGPWVGELARVCESALAAGEKVSLDLADVSFVSREGVRLLWTLRDRRVALLNCSHFVAEQLKSLERAAP